MPYILVWSQKQQVCTLIKPNAIILNHCSMLLVKRKTKRNHFGPYVSFTVVIIMPASVAQLDVQSDWRPGGRGFNPCQGWQHSLAEIDREIFSMVILSLPLIQEGQLSFSGERMCTILVNHLED